MRRRSWSAAPPAAAESARPAGLGPLGRSAKVARPAQAVARPSLVTGRVAVAIEASCAVGPRGEGVARGGGLARDDGSRCLARAQARVGRPSEGGRQGGVSEGGVVVGLVVVSLSPSERPARTLS